MQTSHEMMHYLMPLIEPKVVQVIQNRKKYTQSALVTCLEILRTLVAQHQLLGFFDWSKVFNQVFDLQHHTN